MTLKPEGQKPEEEREDEGHHRVTVRRPRKVVEARDPAALPSRSSRSARASDGPDNEVAGDSASDQRTKARSSRSPEGGETPARSGDAEGGETPARSGDADGDTGKGAGSRSRGTASDINERVRRLSMTEQARMAKRGNQMERAALERRYGKTVWEALLRNPRITQPEVARIARKGTVPRKLLEIICDTPGWLTSPQIRRALLSNRKLTRDMVSKVLRAMPKSELKLAPKQRAYPPTVRKVAEKMLGIQ